MNQIADPSSLLPQPLKIQGVMQSDGLRIALWNEHSRQMIHQARSDLEDAVSPFISRACTHLRGRGGVKGCIRDIQKQAPHYQFVARFDVASFYDSIDHATLLSQLEDTATPLPKIAVVSHYLTEPDITHTGVGLCAGGSISPLLGALYLKPLDDAFSCRDGIFYRRYMDDVVILAKTP